MGNSPSGRDRDLAVKTWFLPDSKHTEVLLEHGRVSGKRLVRIDGKEYVNVIYRIDSGSTHPIMSGKSKITVTIMKRLGGFKYKCNVDGVDLESRPECYNIELESFAFSAKLTKFNTATLSFKIPDMHNTFATLRHSTATGKRKLKIGQETVFNDRRIIDSGSSHAFLYDKKEVLLEIRPCYHYFTYHMTYDGKNVPHHLEELKIEEIIYSFQVNTYDIDGIGIERKVNYMLEVLDGGICIGSTNRQYHEFVELSYYTKCLFGSSKVANKVPKLLPNLLPGKYTKGDHFNNDFILERKNALNSFLKELGEFPCVMQIPGIYDWLGLHIV